MSVWRADSQLGIVWLLVTGSQLYKDEFSWNLIEMGAEDKTYGNFLYFKLICFDIWVFTLNFAS